METLYFPIRTLQVINRQCLKNNKYNHSSFPLQTSELRGQNWPNNINNDSRNFLIMMLEVESWQYTLITYNFPCQYISHLACPLWSAIVVLV